MNVIDLIKRMRDHYHNEAIRYTNESNKWGVAAIVTAIVMVIYLMSW